MQFEDPKSLLEAAAATPSADVDAYALVRRGTRLRRARLAAGAAGVAVVLAGASASVGLLGSGDRGPGPAGADERRCHVPTAAVEDAPQRDLDCLARELCRRPVQLNAVIFLRDDASPGEIEALKQELRASSDVSHLEHVTKAEAYAELWKVYEDQPEVYEPVSPDALPASLRVEAVDEAALARIATISSPAIEEILTSGVMRDRLCGELERTPAYSVPPPVLGATFGEHVDDVLVTLDEVECDATPAWPGAPPPEPGKRWCRFRASIVNLSDEQFPFEAVNQLLQTTDGIYRPWSAPMPLPGETGWRDDPVAPGETRTGTLVYRLPEGAELEYLTLATRGLAFSARPGSFGCRAALEADGSVCSHSSDRAFLRSRYRQAVELYHCGVDPFVFAGRRWVSDPPPFDATNAPADFTGEGTIELLTEREAVYVDSSGAEIELRADDEWEPPPCA